MAQPIWPVTANRPARQPASPTACNGYPRRPATYINTSPSTLTLTLARPPPFAKSQSQSASRLHHRPALILADPPPPPSPGVDLHRPTAVSSLAVSLVPLLPLVCLILSNLHLLLPLLESIYTVIFSIRRLVSSLTCPHPPPLSV
jgi:hypothetical protein